jgi:3-dehydroquinate dehydratase-1
MIAIGNVELGTLPRIAVPLADDDVARRAAAALHWADIIELRVDLFRSHAAADVTAVCETVRAAGAPVLVTVRSPDQGGGGNLSDQRRLALYEIALPFADACDIELRSPLCEAVLALADQQGVTTIVSHHDFAATPDHDALAALVRDAAASGAHITKVAATANSAADRNRLLDLLREQRDENLIVIAMGPYGAASRVFFPLCGSLITYGYFEQSVAPGQLSIQELRSELARYCPDLS